MAPRTCKTQSTASHTTPSPKTSHISREKTVQQQNYEVPENKPVGIEFILTPTSQNLEKNNRQSLNDKRHRRIPSPTDDIPENRLASFRNNLNKIVRYGRNFEGRMVSKPRPGRVTRRRRFINKYQRPGVQTSDSTGWDSDEVKSPTPLIPYCGKPIRKLVGTKIHMRSRNNCSSSVPTRESELNQESEDQNFVAKTEMYRKKLRTLYMCSYKHSRKSFSSVSDIMKPFDSDGFTDESRNIFSNAGSGSYSGDGEESNKRSAEVREERIDTGESVSRDDTSTAPSKIRKRKKREVATMLFSSDSMESITFSPYSSDVPNSPKSVGCANKSKSNTNCTLRTRSSEKATRTSLNTSKIAIDAANAKEVPSNPRLVLHTLHARGERPKWPFMNKGKELQVTCKSAGDMIFLFDSEHWEQSIMSKSKPTKCDRYNNSKKGISLHENTSISTQISMDSTTYAYTSGDVMHIPIVTCDINESACLGDTISSPPQPPNSLNDSNQSDEFALGSGSSLNEQSRSTISPCHYFCGQCGRGGSQRTFGNRKTESSGFTNSETSAKMLGCNRSRKLEYVLTKNDFLCVGNNRCYDLSRGLSKYTTSTVGTSQCDEGNMQADTVLIGSKLQLSKGDISEHIHTTQTTNLVSPSLKSSQKTFASTSDIGTISAVTTYGDLSVGDSAHATRGTDRSVCGMRTLQVSREAEESEGRFACSTIIISKTNLNDEALLPSREPLLLGHLRTGITKKSSRKTNEIGQWISIY